MKELGQWGKDEREHDPTKFETENPDILMLDGSGQFKDMQMRQRINNNFEC